MALTELTKVTGPGIHTLSNVLSHNIKSSGIITATKFSGPLDSIGGNFAGVITATNGVFSGNISAVDGNFSGNVTIGGTLTYEDVTNIDSVGLVTARDGIFIPDSEELKIGNTAGSPDLKLYHDTTNSYIYNSTGVLRIRSNDLRLQSLTGEEYFYGTTNGGAHIYWDNSLRIQTTSSGVSFPRDIDVDGHTNLDNVSIAGVATATTFVGALTGTASGNPTLSNGADNRIITATGANALTGETNLTWTGNVFETNGGVENWTMRARSTGPSSRIGFQNQYLTNGYTIGCGAANQSFVVYTGGNNDRLRIDSTGITTFSQNLFASKDFDVDGHTNLDNVSIAGVTTVSNKTQVNSLGIGIQPIDHHHIHIESANPRILIRSTGTNAAKILFGDNSSNDPGVIEYNHTNNQMRFSTGNLERLHIDSAGNLVLKDHLAQGNSLVNYIQANDVNGAAQYILGQVSTGNQDLYLQQSKNANLRFQTNASTRWKIDGNPGHLLPEVAGAVNIGSATAEIGDVFLADDKKLQIGSSQDLQIYHTTSGTSWIRHTNSAEYFILEGNQMDFRDYATGVYRARMGAAVQLYYNGNNEKFRTTDTGITVTGEVAASQEYPDIQPTFDVNFAASRTLDPRFTFQRVGPASYTNELGKVVLVGENVPRFDYNATTRESLGILIEEERTNYIQYSINLSGSGWGLNNTTNTLALDVVAPDGTTGSVYENKENSSNSYHATHYTGSIPVTNGQYYTISTWLKKGPNYRTDINAGNYQLYCSRGTGSVATVSINPAFDAFVSHSNTTTRSLTKYQNGWIKVTYSFQSNQNSSSVTPHWLLGNGGSYAGNGASSVYIWGCQFEAGSFPTSYIPTNGSTTTRGADLLRIMDDEFKDIFGDEFREFTIVADYDNSDTVDGSIQALVDFWGESTGYTDRIEIFKDGDSPYNIEVRGIANNAGLFANGVANASSKALTQRFATSWSVDYTTSNAANRRWAFSFSGEAVDVIGDAVGTNIPALTRLGLGNTPTRLDLSPGKLHFKRFTFYPKAVSDQQLINLSTP